MSSCDKSNVHHRDYTSIPAVKCITLNMYCKQLHIDCHAPFDFLEGSFPSAFVFTNAYIFDHALSADGGK